MKNKTTTIVSIEEVNSTSKQDANNNNGSKTSRTVAMSSRKQNSTTYGISPEALAALLKNKN